MFRYDNIVFKNHKIKKISDIIKAYLDFMQHNPYASPYHNFSYNNNEAKEKIITIINQYIIINQQKNIEIIKKDNGESVYITKPTISPYSFEDMLRTQDYLEVLDCIESIKYNEYIVNARQLLQKYLYGTGTESHYCTYDINNCNIYNFYKRLPSSRLKNKTFLSISQKTKTLTPSKSIRENLRKFLLEQACLEDCPNNKCFLFSMTNNETSYKGKRNIRFYIPILDIPAFLLLFTLYDGRDFRCECNNYKNTKHNYLNPSKKKLRYSEYSYMTVLSKIDELKINKGAFSIRTIWHCDKIFLQNKLNILFKYYKAYTSTNFLDKIINSYIITYSEVINLKKFITNNIFKDNDFIIAGLKSNYLDFMLLFDIIIDFKTEARYILCKIHDKGIFKLLPIY